MAPLARVGKLLVLDVRNEDRRQAGHAPSATHNPLGQLDATALRDDRTLAGVCRSGNRSCHAAQPLLGGGRDALNLNGSMRDWAARGLPVVASDGSAGDVL